MSAIENAIQQINLCASAQSGSAPRIDVRCQLLVIFAFIVATLSIPVDDPARLLWMFCFPIIMSEAIGVGYIRIFRRSLWILPLVGIIGIFNPLFDTATVWHIGSVSISHGWLTFASLVLRGLLTFQALLILIAGYGFFDICHSMQYFRCPKVLVTQLLMLYRYIGVLLSEALNMHRARQARGYGKKHYPLSMWGVFIGQLLIRSLNRARRINDAMVSRGFSGTYYFAPFASKPKASDYIYLCVWFAAFAVIRFVNLNAIFSHLLLRNI